MNTVPSKCILHGTRVLLLPFILVLIVLQLHRSNALQCGNTLTHKDITAVLGHPHSQYMSSSLCTTDGACFIKVSHGNSDRITRGCLNKADAAFLCNNEGGHHVNEKFEITCCYDDSCNWRMDGRIEKRDIIDDTETVSTTTVFSDTATLRTAAILTVTICVVTMTIVICLVITISVCCCWRHRNYRQHRRRGRQRGDEEMGQSESRISFVGSDCCEAIIPSSQTLNNLLQSAHTHSSPPSLLIQRSVARHTSLEHVLEKEPFYDVYKGKWRNDKVLVKIYASKYERLWFSETELYQICHIPHLNLLSFVAADIIQRNQQTFHYLISEYHERGTLFDYLKITQVDLQGLLVLAESVAAGLTHLHSEITNNQGVILKPSIAHCNLRTKSIYVKMDGTCCIADLSLAVKNEPNIAGQMKGKPSPHVRYMAPELLARTRESDSIDFSSLKKADVYSFALVLWEISRRCLIQGSVEEAVLPYSNVTSDEVTSIEEMREIVCVQGLRPPLAEQWETEGMNLVVRLMEQCWHPKSTERMRASKVRKTLHKLSDSLRPAVDKNGRCFLKCELDKEKFNNS